MTNTGLLKEKIKKTSKKKSYLTNTELLEEKIKISGKKKSYLAEKCGLSRAGFRNCVKNEAPLNASQISVLCFELNIVTLEEKEAIFFANKGA